MQSLGREGFGRTACPARVVAASDRMLAKDGIELWESDSPKEADTWSKGDQVSGEFADVRPLAPPNLPGLVHSQYRTAKRVDLEMGTPG